MKLKISKLQGCGNDFVFTEDGAWKTIVDQPKFVKEVCDRRFGAGADGFVYLTKVSENHYKWDFFNSDGSPAEMCGNAVRCVGRYVNLKYQTNCGDLQTKAGAVKFQVEDAFISVEMPKASAVERIDKDVYFINTGVPHIVIFNSENEDVSVQNYRKYKNGIDATGCNVTLAKENGESLRVKTFERGVEDFTLACGTGAVAAAAVSFFLKEQNAVDIQMPGGDLRVEARKDGLFLVGPANFIYEGEYWYD